MSNYTAMDPNAQPVYVAAPGAQQPVYVVAGAQPPAYQQQVVYAAPGGQYPPQQQYQQPPQGYQQQQGFQPQQYAPPQDGSQPQSQLPPGTQYQGGNGQTVVVVASQQKVSEAQTILLGGLCGCFDDFGSCCLACLCPICLHGMNAQRVNAGNCVVCSVAYWFAWCCVGGYVRGQYFQLAGLPDPGFCVNCCTHCCCVCCALSQEARATTKLAEGGVMMRN